MSENCQFTKEELESVRLSTAFTTMAYKLAESLGLSPRDCLLGMMMGVAELHVATRKDKEATQTVHDFIDNHIAKVEKAHGL